MGEIAGGITLNQVAGLVAQQVSALNIPTMATAAPPGVADSSAAGAASMQYAGANHTHASKARKQIMPISASGLFTWTFPTPFGSGVVPVCNAIAICLSGTTQLVNVQQEGDATNTQVTFRVTVYQQSVASLLGLTILSLSSSPPAGTKLSLLALEP